MTKYAVSLDTAIDFYPETEVAEILQNVRTILTTRIGTVALHRDFGVSWGHLDKPYPVAKSLMMVLVIEVIERFEPRAKVVSVEFDETVEDVMEGLLKPWVIVEVHADNE